MALAFRNRIVGSGEEAPDQLLANPSNWRIHPKNQQAALEGALATVGWVQQVMVNRTTGFVVDGHARVALAISRGEASVPVLYVELEPDEERIVLASLDPIAAMAGTDDEKLHELLADLSIEDPDLAAMLETLDPGEPKAGLTDPDDAPDLGETTHIQRGDLFVLGDHRLLCGDATDAADVIRLFGDAEADCVWTDPPYGVNYVGKTADALTIAHDRDDGPVIFAAACAAARVVPSARFYVSVPAGPRQAEYLAAVSDAGWRLHQELVWVKNSMVLGHSDYHYRHEPILYGFVPGSGRPGRGRHGGSRWYGDHSQTSVLEHDRPSRSAEHPTMKPVALVRQCLTNSTMRRDVVYDPFVGSGSTIIASEQLERRCFAMDIDPRYVAVAIKRWENFTGKVAERG